MTTKDPNLIKTPIQETPTETVDTTAENNVIVNNADTDTNSTTVDNEADAGEVVNTSHVNEGDLAARSPDRRDQEGEPFDGGVNEKNAVNDIPQSEELNTYNRYANVDNAQTRVLPTNDQES